MTDLPDLLAHDRIRCGCEIRSKKRALQTIAELLGASLRDDPTDTDAEDDSDPLPRPRSDTDTNTENTSRDAMRDAGSADATQEPTISDMDILDVAVDVVVGLLVPEECNDEHLQILATLARRFNDDEQRDAIRNCKDGNALMAYLTSTSPSA